MGKASVFLNWLPFFLKPDLMVHNLILCALKSIDGTKEPSSQLASDSLFMPGLEEGALLTH